MLLQILEWIQFQKTASIRVSTDVCPKGNAHGGGQTQTGGDFER